MRKTRAHQIGCRRWIDACGPYGSYRPGQGDVQTRFYTVIVEGVLPSTRLLHPIYCRSFTMKQLKGLDLRLGYVTRSDIPEGFPTICDKCLLICQPLLICDAFRDDIT